MSRQGTPYFMAYEIQTRSPLPAAASDNEAPRVTIRLRDGKFLTKQPVDVPRPRAKIVIPYPGHDIESFWWLILWILLAQVEHTPGRVYANKIFRHSLTPTWERVFAFTSPNALQDELPEKLHTDLLGSDQILVGAVIQAHRSILYHHRQRVRQPNLQSSRVTFVSPWSSVLIITKILLILIAEESKANLPLKVFEEGAKSKPAARKRFAFEGGEPDATRSAPKKIKTTEEAATSGTNGSRSADQEPPPATMAPPQPPSQVGPPTTWRLQ